MISGAAWGRVDLPAGAIIEHPAVKGSAALSCPSCISRDARWQETALVAIGVSLNGDRQTA